MKKFNTPLCKKAKEGMRVSFAIRQKGTSNDKNEVTIKGLCTADINAPIVKLHS
jgi:hypothetical protein